MDDLVTWLLARLDEDERVAREASGDTWVVGTSKGYRPGDVYAIAHDGTPARIAQGTACGPDISAEQSSAHIARHDPARVLAEVEAKRRLLDLYVTHSGEEYPNFDGGYQCGLEDARSNSSLSRTPASPGTDPSGRRMDTEPTHACCVCPQLRPNVPVRLYERAQCCEGCRARLRSLLAELLETYAQVEVERGSTAGSKVSGSRTPPLPLHVTALDLTMPAHPAAVHDTNGDQIGYPSVASVLDSWARDWQTYRTEMLPPPTVSSLVGWLSVRLEWACDHHPAVDDFADELRNLVSVVRSAAGLTRPKAEVKWGIPCRDCEQVTLYRWPGSDYIECGNCPVLMTRTEYDRWCQLISAPEWRPWVEAVVAPQRRDVA